MNKKKNSLLLLLFPLLLGSCFLVKRFDDYPESKWSYESSDIQFYFIFSKTMNKNTKGEYKKAELSYKGNSYDLTYHHRSGELICFLILQYDELEQNYVAGDVLFYGNTYVSKKVCHIRITEDNVFDGSITEMQLTYSSLD